MTTDGRPEPPGGLVTRNPQYRKRSLLMEELKAPAQLRWTADVVAAFRATVKGTTATGVQPIPRGRRPPSLAHGERVLTFRVLVDPVSSWYNDATYLDTLNPAAVRRFIAVTHEEYRRRVGRHFGKTVPGIFTDEPNHGQKFDRDNNTGSPLDLPWTAGLPAAFKKRYGYDLIPHLVELYLDVDGQQVTPARHDFHDCVTSLFVDSFSRQIGAWCEEHGLLHTGHVLMEDRLSSQACVVGSAMRFYEPMQAPGIDVLTERWRAYATAKQVSSVAHQLGKRWRISESYGATGWDFPLVGHKARVRLAVRPGHQPALPAPGLVHDAGRGQARLSRGDLRPVSLVGPVPRGGGLLLPGRDALEPGRGSAGPPGDPSRGEHVDHDPPGVAGGEGGPGLRPGPGGPRGYAPGSAYRLRLWR